MIKKKILGLLFAFSLVFSITVFGTDSESVQQTLNQVYNDYDVYSELPVTELYKGDEVYVNFILSGKASIYGIEAVITYDSDNLKFKEISCPFSKEETLVEIIDTDSDDEILYACTYVGVHDISTKSDDLLSLAFVAENTGEFEVTLKSLKLVYNDLSYEIFENVDSIADISVITLEEEDSDEDKDDQKKPSRGSGSSGGGGGGTRFSASKADQNTVVDNQQINSNSNAEEIKPEEEPTEDNKITFTDISEVQWANDAITALVSMDILNGYEDGTFKPDSYITRAEMAKIVSATFLSDFQNIKAISFTDITPDKWYYDCVTSCASAGIVNGETNEIFAPDRNVTREEFAAMLARCISVKQYNLTPVRLNINFIDEEEISEFAVGYVDMLYTCEVLNGNDGYFHPQNSLTRAEAAVGIYGLLSAIEIEEQGV